MKISISTLPLFIVLILFGAASAATPEKLKTGNIITSERLTYDTRGREIIVSNKNILKSKVEATQEEYTFINGNNKVKYSRNGHYIVLFENLNGVRLVPESHRLLWMPPSDNFDKTWAVKSEFIPPAACGSGTGKFSGEASAKPIKISININSAPVDFDAQEVHIEGTWTAGSCGSGRQFLKFTYIKSIDLVAGTVYQNFLPNGGLLNVGNSSRIVAID